MLPKDDQEMEELMLEEVEVFKVGVTPAHPPCRLLTAGPRAGWGSQAPGPRLTGIPSRSQCPLRP